MHLTGASGLLGHTVVAHRPAVPPDQTTHMSTRDPISQLQVRPHTTNKHAARTLTLRPQDERTTLGSQCADNTPSHIVRKQQCLARARMSPRMPHPNWSHSSRRITQCRCSSKSPALATHSGEHLLLFHGPTVAVHHSVTGIPH